MNVKSEDKPIFPMMEFVEERGEYRGKKIVYHSYMHIPYVSKLVDGFES